MNNVMIDLETLGTKPGSVILSIGAVVFDPVDGGDGLGRAFEATISLESSLEEGLTVEAGTLRWWAGQDQGVYREALGSSSSAPLREVLLQFSAWFPGEARAWGNGASFDLGLLAAAYARCGMSVPWEFWNERCYRTLKSLYPSIRAERTNEHRAINDAINQAKHTVQIFRHIRDAR